MKKQLLSIFILCSMSSFAQWTSQATGFSTPNKTLADISVVNQNVVWAVARDTSTGGHSQEFTRTQNGGTLWTVGNVTAPSNYNFCNISAIDDNTAWVAMYDATLGYTGGVFNTIDGGATWTQQGVGLMFDSAGSFPNTIHFWDANNGIVLGDPAEGYFEIYLTFDGGNSWNRVPQANIPVPQAGETGLANLIWVRGSIIWWGTNQGRVYKSTDGGNNWAVFTVSSNALRDVTFKDDNNGLAKEAGGGLYKTIDGGNNWNYQFANGPIYGEDITYIPNSNILVSTGYFGSSFSYDDGANWTAWDNVFHGEQGWYNTSVGWTSGFNTSPTSDGGYKFNGIFNPISIDSTIIGTTEYQLQTNASLYNRIVKNWDGTISADWTMAHLADFSDRGTGYNYFNGSSWAAAPIARAENLRTGFTNMGVNVTGGEVIVSHQANDIHIARRPVKGTGGWIESSLGFYDTWAHTAIGGGNGNTIHLISMAGGTAIPAPYHGQDGAITYSRSQDGGVTWDILRYVIPDIDSSHYLKFNGDNYAIDSKGDKVAIVIGGMGVDIILLRSEDNGSTWTKTIVKPFYFPLYDQTIMNTDTTGDGIGDLMETSDGSMAVMMDNFGFAHIWYGQMFVTEDLGFGGFSYFPTTNAIMYWNENMGSNPPVAIASTPDLNNNGIIDAGSFGNYVKGFATFPSACTDLNGYLYLSFAGMYEGAPAADGKSYRHTYVTRSTDNGAKWCTPLDITDPDYDLTTNNNIEEVYGSMAKIVDGYVHILTQRDHSPGHGVNVATDPQTGEAEMVYKKISLSSFCAVPPAVVAFSVTDVSCYGGNDGMAVVHANGSAPPYTYLWNTPTGETTDTLSNLTIGTYTVTVFDNTGFSINSTVTVNQPANPLTVLLTTTNTVCGTTTGSATGTINGGTAPYSFLWNTSSIAQPTLSGLAAGSYSVTVTDNNGCTVSGSAIVINVAMNAPSICLATVNDSSTANTIVWDKTGMTGVNYFKLYREVTLGVYDSVRKIPFDSLSEFTDYGANPNSTSWKYKLTVIDSCGNESAKSDYHNTIHLQVLGLGNLQWTLYEIEPAVNPVSYYQINRQDVSGTGTFDSIFTVSGSNTTWTDLNYLSYPNADYRVDVIWSISCSSTRTNISITRSNIRHQALTIPPPVATFIAFNDSLCLVTSNCTDFTDMSTNNPNSWSWTFVGGTPSTSTSQNPTGICYSTAGQYDVTLTATNGGGSNSFTWTNYIVVDACTGSLELGVGSEEFIVYPNPASSTITIALNYGLKTKNYELKIEDVLGQVVYQNTIDSKQLTIDISKLAKGVYTVVVESDYNFTKVSNFGKVDTTGKMVKKLVIQ